MGSVNVKGGEAQPGAPPYVRVSVSVNATTICTVTWGGREVSMEIPELWEATP